MKCDFIADGDSEIRTTLGRVVLFVIISVMMILVQNSGAFAAATFSDLTDTYTFTPSNANFARLTSPYTVVQQDVDPLQ